MGQANAFVISSTVPVTDGGPEGKVNRTWFQLLAKLSTLVGAIATQTVSPDNSIANQTTLQPVINADGSALAFNVAPSEEWLATFTLDVGAGLSTTGLKIAILTPAGASLNVVVGIDPDHVTAADVLSGRTSTAGTAIVFTAANLGGVSNALVTVSVWVLNASFAGPIVFQFAQNTASATALTIRQGSQMVANRVQ